MLESNTKQAKIIRLVASIGAAACLFGTPGCGGSERRAPAEAPVSTLKTPTFKAQMKTRVAAQNRVAARAAEIEARLSEIRARSSAPEKDPEWAALVAAREACVREMAEQLKETRAVVRAAQLQDAANPAAARAGRTAPVK